MFKNGLSGTTALIIQYMTNTEEAVRISVTTGCLYLAPPLNKRPLS